MKRFSFILYLIYLILMTACALHRYDHEPPLAFSEIVYPYPVHHQNISDAKMAYIQEGNPTAPTLLFVHGLASHLGLWEANYPFFIEQGYHVIGVDLPGHGKSDKPHPDAKNDYSMSFFAHHLAGLLDVLNVKKVVLLGHSMGGQIALTFALHYPNRVSALVLVDPAGIETFTNGEAELLKKMITPQSIALTDETGVRENFASRVFGPWDEKRYEPLVKERIRLARTPEIWPFAVAVDQSITGMLNGPVRDRLKEITAPTLIVMGKEDPVIPNPYLHGGSPASIANTAANEIPSATTFLISNAGHAPMFERPEMFNSNVLSFLTSLKETL